MDSYLSLILVFWGVFVYAIPLKNRNRWLLKTIISFAAICGLTLLFCYLTDVFDELLGEDVNDILSIIKNIFSITINALAIIAVLFYKEVSVKKAIFVGCASYASANFVVNAYSLSCSKMFGPEGIFAGLEKWQSYSIRMATFLLCFIIFVFIAWLFFGKSYFSKEKNVFRYTFDTTTLALLVIVFVINICIGTPDITTSTYVMFVLNKMVICLLVLFFQFRQSNYVSLKTENLQLKTMMEEQKKQYYIAKDSIEKINLKAHDIKHMTNVLKAKESISEESVNELNKINKDYDTIFKTGNESLDITLTEKCRKFGDNGIEYSIIADGNALSFMSEIDIYALIGNILENALEAELKIEDKKQRNASLYIKKKGNLASIHEENNCFDQVKFAGGFPLTSKNDKKNHGFGTKSIAYITSKYNGHVVFSSKDDVFSVDILFNLNQ